MTIRTKIEEIEVLVYIAEDGTEFTDEQECLAYESRLHVNTGVKNVFVYFDEGINGKGIYAIHSLKDFTSLSYVLELSRTNQEITGSDISYKSVTATFDKYPFVIVHNPVTQMFKIQTVEGFKRRYDIDKIIEKMKELEQIMLPLEEEPITPPENPDEGEDKKDPPTGDGGETGGDNTGGDNTQGGDNQGTTEPETPVTPPTTGGETPGGSETEGGSTESGGTGEGDGTTDPDTGNTETPNPGTGTETETPVVPPETGGEDGDGGNTEGGDDQGSETPVTPPTTGGETTEPETPPTGEESEGTGETGDPENPDPTDPPKEEGGGESETTSPDAGDGDPETTDPVE